MVIRWIKRYLLTQKINEEVERLGYYRHKYITHMDVQMFRNKYAVKMQETNDKIKEMQNRWNQL